MNFRNIPPVTRNLIIINFIVWLATMIFGAKFQIRLEDYLGLHYLSASDFNPAQLITYMFMHSTGSFAHILFNMFSLWMFGSFLERSLGSAKFLFYYLSCGIGAALIQELTWAWTWQGTITRALAQTNGLDYQEMRALLEPYFANNQWVSQQLNVFCTIGASGAVYGILLAFGMLYPNMPLYMFFIPVPIKAKYMVIGMTALELLIGMSQMHGVNDGVAHFAHLGGMIFGFFIILYWKRKHIVGG